MGTQKNRVTVILRWKCGSVYMMVSFMTVQEDLIRFFTQKQPGKSELQNEQIPFFQVEFLCSVILNLTFTFKYVILLTLAFVS